MAHKYVHRSTEEEEERKKQDTTDQSDSPVVPIQIETKHNNSKYALLYNCYKFSF